MKTIEMQRERCGAKGWYKDGTATFRRVSRWISVKQNYNPSKRNPLYDYTMDERGYKPYQDKFNPENGLYLDYFEFRGKKYAIEQFWSLGNPFYSAETVSYTGEDGKTHYLSGIDSEPLYNPLYIEMDAYGERVRVYEEVAA